MYGLYMAIQNCVVFLRARVFMRVTWRSLRDGQQAGSAHAQIRRRRRRTAGLEHTHNQFILFTVTMFPALQSRWLRG